MAAAYTVSVRPLPAWLTFTVLRLAMIAVPLAVFLLLRVPWLYATLAAVLVGFCLSYVLLRRQREGVARRLAEISEREGRTVPSREDLDEDAIIDETSAADIRSRSDAHDAAPDGAARADQTTKASPRNTA